MRFVFLFLYYPVFLFIFSHRANAENCYLINECYHWRSSSSANPSSGSQLKINPSSVPTEKGWGIEAIQFKRDTDFSFVRGNGRMGAAISPANSEDTFFGAPGFEASWKLYDRKYDQNKFPNQKYTFATAVNLIDKNGSGLRRYYLKLGLMAKYNELSYNTTPGAGLSAAWGPLAVGYSMYDDQTLIDYGIYSTPPNELFKYKVQTYNGGLFLNALVLNYSNLRLESEDKSYLATVHLYTASLSIKSLILTASKRVEDSPALSYDFELKQLETKQIKEEYFGGLQYNFSKNITLGALYNYYLLREYSATMTLFF